MDTVEDRLHALSTTPAPAPPALDDLRARGRRHRRRRTSTAAGTLAVLVALAVLAWSILADTDASSNVVTGPATDGPTSDPCEEATLTPTRGPEAGSIPINDPVRLACQALQHYSNDEPPAAVRLGSVDTATFQDWQRQHTGGSGPLDGPGPPDTVTVLLVRASNGDLLAPTLPPERQASSAGTLSTSSSPRDCRPKTSPTAEPAHGPR